MRHVVSEKHFPDDDATDMVGYSSMYNTYRLHMYIQITYVSVVPKTTMFMHTYVPLD